MLKEKEAGINCGLVISNNMSMHDPIFGQGQDVSQQDVILKIYLCERVVNLCERRSENAFRSFETCGQM